MTKIERSCNIVLEVKLMFTYIKLKNYLSFDEVEIDFRKTQNEAKGFVAIYGENGSGKSNIVSAFDFLRKSIESINFIEWFRKVMEDTEYDLEKIPSIKEWKENNDIELLIKKRRMIGSKEETRIEYGFVYNGHKGSYTLGFLDRIVYEKLSYFTGKQTGTLFEFTQKEKNISKKFSGKLFSNKRVKDETVELINQYWGKHSFLSIFNRELSEKNENFMKDNFLAYLFEVFDMLKKTSICFKKSSRLESRFISFNADSFVGNLDKGKVSEERIAVLNRTEMILNDFFTQAYADIKKISYERETKDETIYYELFIHKMIGGDIRKIPIRKESSGTQRILEILGYVFGVFQGATVVFDEIDDGIHDLLLKNIIEPMIDEITGQLIITTHNTYLLEVIDIKSVYVIKVGYDGKKEVRCLDTYPRIQTSNNPRAMYMKGMFGGIPSNDSIDYDGIISELEFGNSENQGGR